jgi:hypothetical protein
MRWRFLVVLVASAACAPREDYTPRIEVEPHAAARICFFCFETGRSDNRTCSASVKRACAAMLSDVRGPPPITLTNAPDDDQDGDDVRLDSDASVPE